MLSEPGRREVLAATGAVVSSALSADTTTALFLLRPDSYVAFADASGAPEAIDRNYSERGLWLAVTTPY
jgi:hypothetical protein